MKDIIRVAHIIEAVCDNSGEFTAKDKVDLLKYAVKSDILTTNEAIDLVCEYGIIIKPEER